MHIEESFDTTCNIGYGLSSPPPPPRSYGMKTMPVLRGLIGPVAIPVEEIFIIDQAVGVTKIQNLKKSFLLFKWQGQIVENAAKNLRFTDWKEIILGTYKLIGIKTI